MKSTLIEGFNPVYHSYSSNLPHLQSWIDDLLLLTEQSLPKLQSPSTESLVNSLQRYDAVFKELLRQCSIFSEPVSKMFSKVWTGVINLLKYMIKSYHRYVKQTSHLQTQAQTLMAEKQKDHAANKVAKEEFDLMVTALRARVRNLESEQERKVLEHENQKLRKIIDVYIRSAELNDPVWEIMNTEEGNSKNKFLATDQKVEESSYVNSLTRRQVVDEGKVQLRNLNRLDIEMNEIMTNTLKEENRQRLLLKDLMKILTKARESLYSVTDETTENRIVKMASTVRTATTTRGFKNSLNLNSSFSAINGYDTSKGSLDTLDSSVQVDEKDIHGLVLSFEENDKVDVLSLGVAPLAPLNFIVPGLEFPYQIRSCMSSFPMVLRVPPVAWTCQTILSIYLDKLEVERENSLKGIRKSSLSVYVYNYYKKYYGLTSSADVQVALLLKACEAHIKRQSRISLFASQIGLMNKEDPPNMDIRDTDFILQVIEVLLNSGELQSDVQKSKRNNNIQFGPFIRPDISRSIAVNAVLTIFQSLLPDGGEDFAVKVKSLPASELGPRYVDLDQFIELLIEPWNLVRSNWEDHAKFLFREHCKTYRVLQEATFANDDGLKASDAVVVEVKKSSTSDSVRRQLRNFQRLDSNAEETEDHNNGFSTANVSSGKEAVCELIDLKAFINCVQTVNPNIPVLQIEAMFDEALNISHENVLRSLELMWTRYIDHASNYTLTGATTRQSISEQFSVSIGESSDEYNLDVVRPKANHRVLGTNREFWVNNRTSISQWSRPYYPKTFRTQDIEIDIFVQVLIRYDVFPKSPLLDFLNLPPKELWPASATLHKQIKEKMTKGKGSA